MKLENGRLALGSKGALEAGWTSQRGRRAHEGVARVAETAHCGRADAATADQGKDAVEPEHRPAGVAARGSVWARLLGARDRSDARSRDDLDHLPRQVRGSAHRFRCRQGGDGRSSARVSRVGEFDVETQSVHGVEVPDLGVADGHVGILNVGVWSVLHDLALSEEEGEIRRLILDGGLPALAGYGSEHGQREHVAHRKTGHPGSGIVDPFESMKPEIWERASSSRLGGFPRVQVNTK